MKNLISALIFIVFTITATAQQGQSEFSNPSISVGVVVEDLQKSIDFYTKVIGMTKTGEFSVTKEQCTELGLNNKYQLDVSILKLENQEYSTEWKLMSVGTKASHPKQKYMTDDTGIQYVTIFVKQIQPVIERAKKNGVKILSGSPSVLGDGRKFVLVQDPDGTFIEIIGQQ